MHFMNAAVLLAVIGIAHGHSVFTTLFVDGADQGDGTCIRMNMTPDNATFPINDLNSNDMACGYDGSKGVDRICSISQGAKLTFEWREWADGSKPGSIDASHKGPCAVYMKAVSSSKTDPGYGGGWFKIWDSGFNATTKQWCTEALIQNDGLLSVDVPHDLAGGYYLVRPELLALHQADKTPSNPQFYVGCAQVFLDTRGIAVPKYTVSIPGYVHPGEKSVTFNIYQPSFPYPMPGPVPYMKSAGTAMPKEKGTVAETNTQDEGLLPANCVLVNANWCGIELESYSTGDGCWNASRACWSQATTCYNRAPPTGSKNCKIWEDKCTGIQSSCMAGNFNGPPDKGKVLTPAIKAPSSIPEVVPASGDVQFSTSSSTALSLTDKVSTSAVASQFDTTTTIEASVTVTQTPTYTMIPLSSVLTGTASKVTNTFKASVYVSDRPTSTTGSSTLAISTEGQCGMTSQQTCYGSAFGNCCSQYGWCGITNAYCGTGCQAGFGSCSSSGSAGSMRRKLAKHRHINHHHHD